MFSIVTPDVDTAEIAGPPVPPLEAPPPPAAPQPGEVVGLPGPPSVPCAGETGGVLPDPAVADGPLEPPPPDPPFAPEF